jgi:hypothetical protein
MFAMKDTVINLTQVDRTSRFNAIRRISTILFELSSTRKKIGERRKFEFKLREACKPRLNRQIHVKKKIYLCCRRKKGRLTGKVVGNMFYKQITNSGISMAL